MDLLGKSLSDFGNDQVGPVKDFLQKVLQAQGKEPCPPTEDCGDFLCPECEGHIKTIFGSLPLKVECVECGTQFLLRNLVRPDLKDS